MSDLAAANTIIRDLYISIGAQVRAAREQRGATQHDLAAAVGLTRASVGNIESGNQRIQVHTLIAAAQALDVDPADLITRAIQGERPLAPVLSGGRDLGKLARRLTRTRDQIDALLREMTANGIDPEERAA